MFSSIGEPIPYHPPTLTISVKKNTVGFAYLFTTWPIAHQFLRGERHPATSPALWLHDEGGDYLVHRICISDHKTYAFRYYEIPQYHQESETEYVAWAIPNRYYITI